MKKIIALIVAVALISIGTMMFFISGIFKAGKTIVTNGLNVHNITLEEKDYTASKEISEFDISLASENCEILAYDGDKVYIQYTDDKTDPYITISESGDTLKIKYKNRVSFNGIGFNFNENSYVKVYVPEGKIESLSLATASGDVHLKGLTITDDFDMATASGNIKIEDNKLSGKLEMGTASGSVLFADSTVKKLIIGTASGDVWINDAVINGDLSIKTASGSINLESVSTDGNCSVNSASGDMSYSSVTVGREFKRVSHSGDTSGTDLNAESLDADSSSGDYNFRKTTISKDVDINSTSGEVTLSFTDSESNYNVSIHTTSGDSNIGSIKNYNADKKVNISTTSGDVIVKFAN